MTTRFADHLLDGLLAARPAATAVPVGTLYSASDTNLIYKSDGSAWATWATVGGAGSSGREVQVVNRTGVTSPTTTGTTFADIDATNLTAGVTTPTGGRRYQLSFQGRCSNSSAAVAAFDVTLDGTRLVSSSTTGSGLRLISTPAGSSMQVSIVYVTSLLAAGAHTFIPQWRTSTGTLTLQVATAELAQFSVVEL